MNKNISRVIVWGTGNVGRAALRTVVSNPALELVGVIVSNPEKVGRDAGELVGLAPTGIIASNDPGAVLATSADAVAYCASGDFRPDEALDDIERCLKSGLNVVSTSVYPLYDPLSAPTELRERFLAACEQGKSSLFVSGIDPGFLNDLIPMLLSGLCEEINEIRAYEHFNYGTYDAPEAVRDLVGFGMPMDYSPPMVMEGVPTMVWGGLIRMLARTLDVELDEIREVCERRPLEKTVTVPVGTFDKGTQGGLRFEIQGIVGGQPKIIVEHVTRIDDDIAPDWPGFGGHGCHGVAITGRPNISLTLQSEDENGDHAGGGNATAAARIVNAIPVVVAAQPGLLDSSQVPPQVGRGLLR